MSEVYQYEQDAYNGTEMPGGLDQPDQLCYQTLAALYKRYQDGAIEREAASAEKRKIIYQWKKAKETAAFFSSLAKRQAELWKAVERGNAAYRKERTLEHADRLSGTIDGLDAQR